MYAGLAGGLMAVTDPLVVIEHDMHVVFSLANKISVLAQGTVIAEDLPENIKGNAKVQEAYLGGAHL
jgi:branched-chain amino acid transport system ATP-binding protein